MCSPSLLPHLRTPADLARMTLLHEEMAPLPDFPTWADWLTMVGLTGSVDATRGPRFSHSHMMLQAAVDGRGVCLGQTLLAADDLASGRLVAPFASMPPTTLPTGYGYYVVCPQAAADRPKIKAFREWVMAEIASVGTAPV
jgi:LysR family glycine cleavage system transcriptional activator